MSSVRAAVAIGLLGLAACRAADARGTGPEAAPGTAGAPWSTDVPEAVPPDTTDPEALVSALGCGACHTGVPNPAAALRASPTLGHRGRAMRPDSLLAYLLSPSPARSSTAPSRMPSFHLSEPEALALTLFLETTLPEAPSGGGGRARRLGKEHPAADAALGRRIFRALDCGGCHDGTGVEGWKSAPDLSNEGRKARRGWLTSWLAHPVAVRRFGFYPGTGTRMPDFGLSPSELRTLIRWLAPEGGAEDGSTAPAGRRERARGAVGAFPSPPAGTALSPFREAEAFRLLRDHSACLGCHAIAGEGGRIGPDLAGLRSRRPAAYVWAMLRDPRGTRPRSVMPRSPESPARDTLFYRLLVGGDLARLATGEDADTGPHDGYLDLVSNPLRAPDAWMLAGRGQPSTPEALYRQTCSSCHGIDGRGDGYNARHLPVPPARHADSAAMAVRTDARLFDAVYGGGRVLGRSPRMPAFGRSLSRREIWGLVGHIRQMCGCRGPAWARDNGESGVPAADSGRGSRGPGASRRSPGGGR